MSKVVAIILVGMVAYLAGLLLIYIFQRNFMYIPPLRYKSPTEVGVAEMREIRIPLTESEYATAWWVAPQDGMPTVMFFHGNGGALYHDAHIFRDLIDDGFGVWVTGYPGYPGASGRASQPALQEATQVQFDLLSSDYADGSPITLYGTSLGAGQAVQLAAVRPVSRMVVEAPFYSMYHMVRRTVPIYAFKGLVKDKWESHKALEAVDIPILWVHGQRDRAIPLVEGQRLYDGYKGDKAQFIIANGNHINIWVSGGRERITEFLKSAHDHP